MTVPTNTRMLDAALEYASLNWHIVPLWEPAGPDTCSCPNGSNPDPELRCSSVGKHPRTMHGLSDATTDVETITRWWTQWPKANIGVNCGKSGLVVVDVDPRHGGDEDWRDCQEKYGQDITATVTAITGGGGEHYVFTAPQGYSVGNISNSDRYIGPLGRGVDVRASGGYFVAPPSRHASGKRYEWDASPFDTKPARVPLPLLEVLSTPPSQNGNKEPISAARILEGVQEGGRDWALFQLASKLRYADVPIDMAYYLIEQAALNCKPPFPRAEARDKVNSAYKRYEPGAGAFVGPDDVKHAEGLTGRVDLWPVMNGEVHEPDWLVPGILLAGMVTLLHGEPGCGKTILALAFARDLARQGMNVLFIDEESGVHLVAERLRLMGLTQEEAAHIHYYPFAGITLKDTDELVVMVESVQPALVIWDSMADVLSVSNLEENDAGDVTKWMVNVAVRIARRTTCTPAALILDHNTKSQETVKYARGSGAKKAKSDVAFFINKTAEFDNVTLGRVRLERTKNRPGYVPESTLYVVGGKDGTLIVEPFDALRHEIFTANELDKKALDALAEAGEEGLQNGQLQGILGRASTAVKAIMTRLVSAGYAEPRGAGRAVRYVLINRTVSDSNQAATDSHTTANRTVEEPPPFRGGSDRPITGWAARAHKQYKDEDWGE